MPDDVSVGRLAQAVRLSRNLCQAEVAARARVTREAVSMLERRRAEELRVSTLRSISRALVMPPVVTLGWRSPEVDRLRDHAHAAMVDSMVALLSGLGWEARAEYSFAWGSERGSVDVLAWHASTRALLIVETKSRLWDLQDTLSTLDRKGRLVPQLVASSFGWQPARKGVLLVLPETRSHRRSIDRHEATFRATLPDRQVAVRHWLRSPAGGLRGIWFLAEVARDDTRQRVGPRRVRASPQKNRKGTLAEIRGPPPRGPRPRRAYDPNRAGTSLGHPRARRWHGYPPGQLDGRLEADQAHQAQEEDPQDR